MKSYKSITSDGTAEDIIATAVDDLIELGGELREWADSMSENLQNSDKYTMLTDSADALESLEVPDIDWPHSDARITYHTEIPRRKNRQPSRQVRLDNANNMIQAVIAFYEGLDDDFQEICDTLGELITECEIPGMYG